MRGFRLSDRMEAVAEMVPFGVRVADVGCDHAYVSIYLADHKGCTVYATDLRDGPLAIAMENIKEAGLEEKIDIIKSDGLKGIEAGDIDAVVIAGMGGLLIRDILDSSKNTVDDLKYLILQPQSEISELRRFIHSIGFDMVDEDMVWDDGKPYFMMRCEKASKILCWSDIEYSYGKRLIEKKHPGLLVYLKRRLDTLKEIEKNLKNSCMSEKVKERIATIEQEEMGIKDVLSRFAKEED